MTVSRQMSADLKGQEMPGFWQTGALVLKEEEEPPNLSPDGWSPCFPSLDSKGAFPEVLWPPSWWHDKPRPLRSSVQTSRTWGI